MTPLAALYYLVGLGQNSVRRPQAALVGIDVRVELDALTGSHRASPTSEGKKIDALCHMADSIDGMATLPS